MRLKNLTPITQKVEVVSILDNTKFDVYVVGSGSTEVPRAYVNNPEAFAKIFSISDNPILSPISILDTSAESDKNDEVIPHIDEKSDDKTPDTESETVNHVCDICGAEFASARGLSSHKNRVHSEESNKEE